MKKILSTAAILGLVCVGLTGCQKKEAAATMPDMAATNAMPSTNAMPATPAAPATPAPNAPASTN